MTSRAAKRHSEQEDYSCLFLVNGFFLSLTCSAQLLRSGFKGPCAGAFRSSHATPQMHIKALVCSESLSTHTPHPSLCAACGTFTHPFHTCTHSTFSLSRLNTLTCTRTFTLGCNWISNEALFPFRGRMQPGQSRPWGERRSPDINQCSH